MLVRLHCVDLLLHSNSSRILDEWEQLYHHFVDRSPIDQPSNRPMIRVDLNLQPELPSRPEENPLYVQSDLAVYQIEDGIILRVRRLGHIETGFTGSRVNAIVTPQLFNVAGALEDIVNLGIAPLIRRRGCVLIHAFAASFLDRALLLVGDSGQGKTTTGLTLLKDGWKFLANDVVCLREIDDHINGLSYPGLIRISRDAVERVPGFTLRSEHARTDSTFDVKIQFSVNDYFPSPWQDLAPVGAVCILKFNDSGNEHRLIPQSPALGFSKLLPHSVDLWDRDMLNSNLDLYSRMVQRVPIYVLELADDVSALPALLEKVVMGCEQSCDGWSSPTGIWKEGHGPVI